MKIEEITYTDANPGAATTTPTVNGVVTIQDTKQAFLPLDVPQECMLSKLVLKQLSSGRGGGTGCTVTVNVFEYPIFTATGQSVAAALTSVDNAPLYEAMPPTATTASGTVLRVYPPQLGGDGYPFRNREGKSSNPVRKLYIHINPGGTGPTKWEFSITYVQQGN